MKRKAHQLDPFINPRSIALSGSMQGGRFFGPGVIVRDLLQWNYSGRICPIRPTASCVYGLDVCKDLSEVPAVPDLAVIATSYKHMAGILRRCGPKGIRSAVMAADPACAVLGKPGDR